MAAMQGSILKNGTAYSSVKINKNFRIIATDQPPNKTKEPGGSRSD